MAEAKDSTLAFQTSRVLCFKFFRGAGRLLISDLLFGEQHFVVLVDF